MKIPWLADPSNFAPKNIEPLIHAVRAGKLILFVGNGPSRISGAPGWSEIMRDPSFTEKFFREGIDIDAELKAGTSLLDLAEVLWQERACRDAFIRRLEWWKESGAAGPKPAVIHSVLRSLEPARVVTTNVDTLLDLMEFPRPIVYLHGKPSNANSWIFTRKDYSEQLRRVESEFVAATMDPDAAALFVGYGHSLEDFDVIQAWKSAKRVNERLFGYSLFPEDENLGIRAWRLRDLGIRVVSYTLPREPTLDERHAGLVAALSSIIKGGGIHLADALDSEIYRLFDRSNAPRKNPVVLLGLAALNKVSYDPKGPASSFPFPKNRRSTMRHRLEEEPGGSSLIAARVIARLGTPALLFSRLGTDPEGESVWSSLGKERSGSPQLLLDGIERERSDKPLHSTWSSFVLVHARTGQRVFIDRETAPEFLQISNECANEAARVECRAVYFDRFYSSMIDLAITPHLLKPDCWSFFETGERGGFGDGYRFERSTGNNKVNFALSSFHFATHFLYEQLGGGRMDALNGHKLHEYNDKKQNSIIENTLGDPLLLNEYIEGVARGAGGWLRDCGPRVVLITLHGYGCVWIVIDDKGREEYGYIKKKRLPGPVVCTACAGDVFRGAFVAAVLYLRDRKPLSRLIREAAEFANIAASIKVRYHLVTSALPEIQRHFQLWKMKVK